ncbi:MAG: hypothetical protein IJ718_00970 [Paludibacteraceae bacterium]|nr:hypothetical protein [Paludibacteraceae bacterium]
MKKMYKKPITDKVLVNTKLMSETLGVSSGGTTTLEDNPVGAAPKRRTRVF